jgi:RluA family pseudouridine synthase
MKSRSIKITQLEDGSRFDLAAASAFPDLSRKKIKSILDAGGAYLNKKRITIAKFSVREGDKLELFWDEGNFNTQATDDMIICENDSFFVINKPACIATQSTLSSSKDTIFYALNKLNPVKFKIDQMFMVHRLDKDTSGILIIAKSKSVQKKIEDLFREKKVEKTYHALCFHKPPQNEGSISFPIAKDQTRQNFYLAITNKNSHAKDVKQAQTDYKIEKDFVNEDCSYLICSPKTGRTHQIRVHLSASGCPVIGDKSYAQNVYGNPHVRLAARHMLHAQSISFELNGEKFQFEARLPEDFLSAIRTLEKSSLH